MSGFNKFEDSVALTDLTGVCFTFVLLYNRIFGASNDQYFPLLYVRSRPNG